MERAVRQRDSILFKVFWNTIGLYGLLLAIRPLLAPVVWLFATQEQKISLTAEVIWMDMLRRALAPHLVVSIVVAGLISWIVIIKLDSTEGKRSSWKQFFLLSVLILVSRTMVLSAYSGTLAKPMLDDYTFAVLAPAITLLVSKLVDTYHD